MIKVLQEQPDIQYMEWHEAAEEAMKDFIKDYMRMIGSSNRYTFDKFTGEELD